MTTTAEAIRARTTKPSDEPLLAAPEGTRPRRGTEFADALYVQAIGHADGVAEHLAAAAERALAGLPAALERSARVALEAAERLWVAALATGDPAALATAARDRHAAAEEVEAMAWRPRGTQTLTRGPADTALARGMSERAELRRYWAALMLELGVATQEQVRGGLGFEAAPVQHLVARSEEARKALDSPAVSAARAKTARKLIDDVEGMKAQVRALAGLAPTEGAVR